MMRYAQGLGAGRAAWRLALACALLLPAHGLANAAGPDRAYGAYQGSRYFEAMRLAAERIEADNSDAAAMTLLGEILSQGFGVPRDLAKAAEWYRFAAERGDPNAMFALAMLKLEGGDVAADAEASRAWMEKAAAKGHPKAAFNLALVHLGAGTPEGLERAVELLGIAAKAEIADAQHALAVLMLEGRGVPKDEEGGADMMGRAAENGSTAGEVEYAILKFTGRGVGRDERGAAWLFLRAAYKGNAIAQNRLARIIQAGRWLPRNPVEMAAWHLAARAQGLDDRDLDNELANLTPEDRLKAEALARDRLPPPPVLTSLPPARHTKSFSVTPPRASSGQQVDGPPQLDRTPPEARP